MKTSIAHLPNTKQREIAHILNIIKEEASPEKVILFGSHARGNWVEDEYVEGGIHFGHISDYDFLVIMKKEKIKEQDILSHIENRCNSFKNVISPIIHDIEYINEGLRVGQYFFSDIIAKGILIHDTGSFQFEKAKELTSEEEKERARSYFNIWYPQASQFLIDAINAAERGKDGRRNSVFYLHQATECFYSAALLVHTGYKPKTHNLAKLRNYAKHVSIDLYTLFRMPILNEQEFHLFDLLKRGYTDTRYKLDYDITEEELKGLIDKVTKMQEIVKTICEEKIK
ncbi:MAG: HEPN domain-containing protein [Candidatus Pedobacter colombiensis]|uniref:HEPN domain-containing protein n=1 Tax=Candidatus Pedobacter colombiensis TaxID=3121371 RepID=A0AAJ5W5E4_9SPHI|nr:HEPN domain-containing protein [Pedobacter sp.]WEK17428.1 MAG: HEPN domain-containing protein [Pedobacter sp.]